jgi:small-conductance mechanosensitive channel
VEKILKEAAIAAGLSEPFVLIRNLGDFSITYRVAGLLDDTKTLITSRSVLRQKMLDTLHNAEIEIVSPNFMNQRVFDTKEKFIPVKSRDKSPKVREKDVPESLIFDKAEKAESITIQKSELEDEREKIAELKKSLKETTGEEREKIQKKIAAAEKKLEDKIEELNQKTTEVHKED